MPTLLLVEDNELNRDMLSRRLEKRGYTVLLAEDAQRGLSLVLEAQPDLILMDMSLPGLDGWEASRRLKADPASAALPIIALTAHALADDRERALEAGCDEFEPKPVDLSLLLVKIRRLLGQTES
jgi:two-component system cell cycle response regulator DivK